MVGISIATKWEWQAVLEYFHKTVEDCTTYPYGEYFFETINEAQLLFYSTVLEK